MKAFTDSCVNLPNLSVYRFKSVYSFDILLDVKNYYEGYILYIPSYMQTPGVHRQSYLHLILYIISYMLTPWVLTDSCTHNSYFIYVFVYTVS